jgi:hypothetical protein
VNHNQFDERTVKIGEYSKKKIRDRQLGEHKINSTFSDTTLLLNKDIDMPAPPDSLCPYTVDTAPGTNTDNSTSDTYSLNTVLNTCTIDSAPRNMADNIPDTNTTDTITSSSAHTPSISTSNATFCSDNNNNITDSSISNYNQVTYDETHKPPDAKSIPSCTSQSASNPSVSENAHNPSSINDGLRPSDVASISENDHEETEANMGAGDNKQILGENQKKSQSSNASLKGKHRNPILLPMRVQAK